MLALKFIVLFVVLVVIQANVSNVFSNILDATKGQTVSASVLDTTVKGVEGLNINWEVPFNYDGTVFGFKYNFGTNKKTPESLFARRTFTASDNDKVAVNANFQVDDKKFGLCTKWENKKIGLGIGASFDSKDILKKIAVETSHTIKGIKLNVEGAYDHIKNQFDFNSHTSNGDIGASLEFNSKDLNPYLTISKKLDDKNSIAPTISLKNGNAHYKWTRNLDSGSISADFHPSDNNVIVEWKDQGASGDWTTKAEVPLDNSASTKISVSRKWNH